MSELVEKTITERFPDALVETKDLFGVLNLTVDKEYLLQICTVLFEEDELRMDYLDNVTAVDYQDRIEVIYQIYSMEHRHRIALRVKLDRERPEVESVCSVWKGANYQEREVYDLMGVVFINHPELERILLPTDWEGYPLRKDYVIPD